jgi:hypothetical protein
MLKNDVIIPGNQWPIDDTDEQHRQHRIRENQLLFRGRIHQIQSMINWNQRVTSDWTGCVPALVAANFYKPITLLCADLLYGEQGDGIGAACVNRKTEEAVKRIIKDNKFNALAYEVGGLAASYRKDGLYSIAYDDKQKKIKIYSQPANYWFPVVDQSNVKHIIQDIVAWPEKHNDRFYLRKQVHESGAVWNFMYELNQVHVDQNKKNSIENHIHDAKIGRLVKMSDFGIEALEYVDTKIDRSLIVHCPNWGVDDDIHGVDDYEDLDTLIIELAVMLSRNSLVLAKHTDPNMCGDPVLLQQDEFGNYKLPMGGKFFPYNEGGAKPEYLTWDGKLEAAEKQIDRLIELIFYISETSPAAFGMDKVSTTESGAALKKRLMRTIAKVNRKKMYADPAIKSALEIAQMMDVEWAGGNYEVEEPTITWEDGLPDDELEQAQVVGQRVKDGTLSQLEGIMRLDKCDEETAKKKLKQIQEEKDAALPAFTRSQTGAGNNPGANGGQPPQNPFQQQGGAGQG